MSLHRGMLQLVDHRLLKGRDGEHKKRKKWGLNRFWVVMGRRTDGLCVGKCLWEQICAVSIC